MIDASHLEPLRLRKAQIDKRMSDLANRRAKIDAEILVLSNESQAMVTTLETMAKVYGIDLSDQPEIKSGKVTGGISTKPEGTPTLFEMVSIILDDWCFLDDTFEAQDIYDEIKKRWWPDAPRNSIIPSLWRFAEEKRIIKEGTRYGPLPKDETPGAATPSASKPEEELDDEIPF